MPTAPSLTRTIVPEWGPNSNFDTTMRITDANGQRPDVSCLKRVVGSIQRTTRPSSSRDRVANNVFKMIFFSGFGSLLLIHPRRPHVETIANELVVNGGKEIEGDGQGKTCAVQMHTRVRTQSHFIQFANTVYVAHNTVIQLATNNLPTVHPAPSSMNMSFQLHEPKFIAIVYSFRR